jgi:hypothetical protein
MNNSVKAIRIGDKLMLFIDGKKQTISRKIAPEAFDKAVEYIKAGKQEELKNMFGDVNTKIADYAKGIFKIVGNNVYAQGESEPAPKLVARKMFEMMQSGMSPEPLKLLNKKMHRNGKGVAAGMDIFSKMDNIPMTTKGNLVLKVGMSRDELKHLLQTHGTVVGSPKNSQGANVQHDLPVVGFDYEEKGEYVYCLVDPSDIIAFFNGNIRVGRYKILQNYTYEDKSVVNVPLEDLFDLSFDIWEEKGQAKGRLMNKVE